MEMMTILKIYKADTIPTLEEVIAELPLLDCDL